jgi:hypothetical protein
VVLVEKSLTVRSTAELGSICEDTFSTQVVGYLVERADKASDLDGMKIERQFWIDGSVRY